MTLCGVLFLSVGCRARPDRWEQGQKKAEAEVAAKGEAKAEAKANGAPAAGALGGAQFNKFFPADGVDGFTRTFTAEKEGFAEAKFAKDATEVRVAVTDTITNPDAVSKYASATEKIGDSPVVASGMKTAALVKGRLQVSVMSQQLDAAGRKAVLEKFDLAGLAGLVP